MGYTWSMPELLFFTSAEFPEKLKWQAVSFLRVQWPAGFTGENRLRDWVTREDDHPIHIVLVEKDILISHANVVWRYLEHNGVMYKAYGLTGVFTFPSFRGQGCASQVIAEGTAYIQKSDADVAILFCDESLRNLYAHQGWLPMDGSTTYIGTREQPELVEDEILMMLFLSPKGQQGRAAFETGPFHFGGDYTW